ncbi:MAG: hypothetical protein JO088_03875, partial [Acidobacteria bacterium]|nr:hypothetical protein [Acidobacteriota bacterium]
MDAFPSEFADLLNKRGQRLLSNPPRLDVFRKKRATPIVVFDDVIDRRVANACIALLDRAIYPVIRRMETPIPREWISSMKKNYTDKLLKTVRVKTATLNSRKSFALDAARSIGLSQMMRSESFRVFAESIVGMPVEQGH